MRGAVQSPSWPIARLDAAAAASLLRRELVGWAWLAVGALAVAGVFALLLALSRMPGMDSAPLWPIGFFYKGLVIHVVFSFVIWLLGVFAFLVTVATQEVGGDDPRAAPLGRIGQGVVLVAFPCLFAPAFFDATQPELTNYVPLIRHPAYDLGLLLLAAGLLAPVIRLLVNLPQRGRPLPALTLAMSIGGFVYLLAFVSFAIAGILLARQRDLTSSRELLFWGGGHLLSFVYAIVLLTNWLILARRSLGERAVDENVFRIAVSLVGLLAIPGPIYYGVFDAFSGAQHEAFRLMQFGIALPTLVFAVSLLVKARALGRPAEWPWRDPAFFTLAASLALFALGGVMGFLISGSDTRTPAHYHAVITAVSVFERRHAPDLRSRGARLSAGFGAGDSDADRALRRRAVRRLDRHVRRRRIWGGAEDAGRRGLARRRRRRRHGGARDRLDLHHSRRGGLRRDRHNSARSAEGPCAGMTALAQARAGAARWMPLLALFAVGLLAMAAFQAHPPAPTADVVELLNRDPAQLSPIFDASGREVEIESFRGRTVVLNLWAPWCGPCLEEMPSLDRLPARLPEKETSP